METRDKIKLERKIVFFKWFFRLENRLMKRGIFNQLIVLLDDTFFQRNEQYETTGMIRVVVEPVTIFNRKH